MDIHPSDSASSKFQAVLASPSHSLMLQLAATTTPFKKQLDSDFPAAFFIFFHHFSQLFIVDIRHPPTLNPLNPQPPTPNPPTIPHHPHYPPASPSHPAAKPQEIPQQLGDPGVPLRLAGLGVMGFKQCHINHPKLGMVDIAPVKC